MSDRTFSAHAGSQILRLFIDDVTAALFSPSDETFLETITLPRKATYWSTFVGMFVAFFCVVSIAMLDDVS